MDVNLQGILLRVLEQGEVLPLFGAEPPDVRHLIIGVVNEDPEALTREHEARSLQRTKDLLGSLVGVFLSEGLNRGRRLRPDLYYRFSRTLYVKLPPLRDRREDIPILFYRPCLEAVEAELRSRRAGGEATDLASQQGGAPEGESVGILVDLKAYELLMRPDLDWPGNIRQVQKVARDVAVEACRQSPKGPIVRVERRMVEKVLQKRFPAFPRPDVSSSDA